MSMENCEHVNRLKFAQFGDKSSLLKPRRWSCTDCGTTESVWACLHCSRISCGRFIKGHALAHFYETNHALCIEINQKYVFCYICDKYIFNDNKNGDIDLLRRTLHQIETKCFEESKTRSGRVIRQASVSEAFSENRNEAENARQEDKRYTAICHWRLALLSKAFQKLRENVKEKKQKETEEAGTPVKKGLVTIKLPQKRKRVLVPGVTGLRNLGNTCYMNSVLQALSHLQFFRHCFLLLNVVKVPEEQPVVTGVRRTLSYQYMRQTTVECYQQVNTPLNKDLTNRGGFKRPARKTDSSFGGLSGGSESKPTSTPRRKSLLMEEEKAVSLSRELHAVLRVIWSGKWAIVTPLAILHAVWQLIPSFHGYSQQDAQEFLCMMLDRLQTELFDLESSQTITLGSQNMESVFPKDIITNAFEGQLESCVTCLTCNLVSKTQESFWDLSLDFPDRYQVEPSLSRHRTAKRPSSESCNLTELLERFVRTEELEGRIYSCDHCSKTEKTKEPFQFAQKQLKIVRLPEVLRLHLKRFRWYFQRREKINSHVQFETELYMNSYCQTTDEKESVYDLSGVIIHHGKGFSSGHYTAYCWNEEAESWVHCNDARMTLCSEQEVLSSQAYILLYTRRHGRTAMSNLNIKGSLPKSPIHPPPEKIPRLDGKATSSINT